MSPCAREDGQDAIGFVLAGGRSSRMGQDKSLASFAGRPLVAIVLEVVRDAGVEALIAGARSPLNSFAPVVEDIEPDRGPLGGICAALSFASARRVVFLSVDLPLLPASLVAFLLHHARITGRSVTLASVNGFAQTFPAVLDRAALPVLEYELNAGRSGCFSGFQAAAASLGEPITILPVELFVQSGHVAHPCGLPAARWFLNVNSPQDLRRAEALSPSRLA